MNQQELDARIASRQIAIDAATALSKATWASDGHGTGHLEMEFLKDQNVRTAISKALNNKTDALISADQTKHPERKLESIESGYFHEMSDAASKQSTRIIGHPPLISAVLEEAKLAVKARKIPTSFKGFMPTQEEKVNKLFNSVQWEKKTTSGGAEVVQATLDNRSVDDAVRTAFSEMIKAETTKAFESHAGRRTGETVKPAHFANRGREWVVTISSQVHDQIASRLQEEGRVVDEAMQQKLQSQSRLSPSYVAASLANGGAAVAL